MRSKGLYKPKHPFDPHPFEAFWDGSWQSVELIRIRDGSMCMHLTDNRSVIEEKRLFTNLRVKSRPANLNDCTCYLRPGLDICVISLSQDLQSSETEDSDPVRLDAKISSIERKPHDSKCACQFYINLYVNQDPHSTDKAILCKEVEVIGIDKIAILQKLHKSPCEDQYYRWDLSEDSQYLSRTKMNLGKFSSDLSWLLAASVLKHASFDVKSVENKIVYQILSPCNDNCSSNSDNHLHAVNFKLDNGITTSSVFQCVPAVKTETNTLSDTHEAETSMFYEVSNLRRSKRRNIQPDRFLGCKVIPESEIGAIRLMPNKPSHWKEEEDMDMPLACMFGAHSNSSQDHAEDDVKNFLAYQSKSFLMDSSEEHGGNEMRNFLTYRIKDKFMQEKSVNLKNGERENELAVVPFAGESEYPIALNQFHPLSRVSGNNSQEMFELYSKYFQTRASHSAPRKKFPKREEGFKFTGQWDRKILGERVGGKRHRSVSLAEEDYSEPKVYKKSTLSAGAFNKLIHSYMKNIDSTKTKNEANIVDKWKEFKTENDLKRSKEVEQSENETEEETSENDMLWKEMELSMASAYILEQNEDPNAGVTEPLQKLSCPHDYILDEEIGVLCRICGYVSTEIKHVSAPFLLYKGWTTEHVLIDGDHPELNLDADDELDNLCNQAPSNVHLQKEADNVWALIPEVRDKLHLHQKKAFEFLWRNIAGSLEPACMKPTSKKTGGCVISHTPGAGKTFLIIAFLVSYLKLFPGKRPLVLAPKTTLYTWYKECIKWEIPIPVHLIHGRRSYRIFRQNTVRFQGGPRPSNDVMHVLDCLEKIHKWHAQPSVLIMGYTSFLTLMREDSKFAHRKYMAKVLRESPGLLILDEGHNPRSTKSRLRKGLMKVKTNLRILLSGTLFQNNFCEYFNTLCLARPKFVNEVLRKLDPKFKRRTGRPKKAWHLLESRARKFFLDNIAKKIDTEVGEESLLGIKMLKKITSGFIDVYEGGSNDGLPGLQIYTLLMNSHDVQREILQKLQKIMDTYTGYPLELELLITLASIHPWLVKTSNCVHKFFSRQEVAQLDNYKFDSRRASKVMFVMNLVCRVIEKEKVLIFCHNIAPIHLFLELFELIFNWQKGKEILVLTGDLELFERGKVMDKFEEPGGASRILLASITACAEGISLTAASRVILLDSEWNPSKTKQAIARAFRPGQQKVVYVYQLLATGTLEEDKYRRTTWKEWVSSMIFSEAFVQDPSRWQAEKIEDDVLREMVGEDRAKLFHIIMKNEKASTG